MIDMPQETEEQAKTAEDSHSGEGERSPWLDELTPREIVAELDRYIIGQDEAKRAVAIAMRNRWRRLKAPEDIRAEILPNNIIMIGPTGVGKTEIARRLARLSGAPFVKVEASKFTEVGYVGRDVESMIRELVDSSINMVRGDREDEVLPIAQERSEERLLDLLLPPPTEDELKDETERSADGDAADEAGRFVVSESGEVEKDSADRNSIRERSRRTREKLRKLLNDEKLEDREVEIEIAQHGLPIFEFTQSLQGGEGMEINLGEMLQEMLPKKTKRRNVKVSEARRILLDEELKKLIDMDDVVNEALDRVENNGIVFVDEIDKVAGERGTVGPDVSREGVQRDLLPVVEGCTVQTKYGYVRTDHILFIAAGAFNVSKPSDLIPELQGRFPIRVALLPLTEADFVRIMTEPENSLTKQYQALCASDGVSLEFTDEGIAEVAKIARTANDQMENIGARRLHTVMTTLLEDLLFDLPNDKTTKVVFDADVVKERLRKVVEDEDLRKYIL